MDNPWTFGPRTISATGGSKTVIPLSVPWRGTITRIRLDQVAASSASGTLSLYTSDEAAHVAAGSPPPNLPPNHPALVAPEQYSVFGKKTISNGVVAEYGVSYIYRNMKSTRAQPDWQLWAVLDLGGSGDLTFLLSMDILVPTKF